MIGFHFPRNFDQPYRSRSVTEFWRRWHISLSTWFRDYLYIPLGGNRLSPWGTIRNLMIVFLLCGAWHGAQWTFVAWGAWHGLFLLVERLWRFRRTSNYPFFGHLWTAVVVAIGWAIFRSDSLSQAWNFVWVMFGVRQSQGLYSASLYMTPVVGLTLAVAVVASAWNTQRWASVEGVERAMRVRGGLAPWAYLAGSAVLFVLCAMALASGTHNPFIYYRF